jgi:hypothetical protein
MLGRHYRPKLGIHVALKRFAELEVDICSIQETNAFRAGPISYLSFIIMMNTFAAVRYILKIAIAITTRFRLRIIGRVLERLLPFTHPWNQLIRAYDYAMMIEALFLPLIVIDTAKELIAWARDNTPYRYAVRAPLPRFGMNGGLLVLSRHPLLLDGECAPVCEYLPADIGNTPSFLSVSAQVNASMMVRLINLHMIAHLPNNTVAYRFVNICNAMFGCRVTDLNLRAAKRLAREIDRFTSSPSASFSSSSAVASSASSSIGGVTSAAGRGIGRVIVAGDVNIDHYSPELAPVMQTMAVSTVPLAPMKNGPITTVCQRRFPGEGQIDYIAHPVSLEPSLEGHPLAKLALLLPACERLEDMYDSDHYPIFATLELH